MNKKFKNILPAVIFLFLLIFSQKIAQAVIIFEENFDDHSNWSPSCNVCSKNPSGYSGGGDEDGVPTNWDYWRNDEFWNPNSPTPIASSNPGLRIANKSEFGGGVGKCLVVTNESENTSPDGGGSGWASDAILTKYLGANYPEIYVRYKMRFKPGFKRHWTIAPDNLATIKTFRLAHWDGGNLSPYLFFSSGYSAPIANFFQAQDQYGGVMSGSIRCDPQATNYSCSYPSIRPFYTDLSCNITGASAYGPDGGIGTTDSSLTGIWDGQEHTMIAHLKLNSAPGVADGVYEFIYDGCVTKYLNNMQYIQTGGDINAGWNVLHLGGNVYNNYLGITDHVYQDGAEQWYTFDDIVVSTEYIDEDYVIGDPQDTTPPAAPTGLGVQ